MMRHRPLIVLALLAATAAGASPRPAPAGG